MANALNRFIPVVNRELPFRERKSLIPEPRGVVEKMETSRD
jgi:hypothetical protein